MATPPQLEASGIATASTGGATKTFNVTVPGSLANSVLAFSVDWFEGSSSLVTGVTVSGSATGVVEVGTQQSGRTGDSDNEGMWLGYKLAPASGSVAIVVTFSSSQSFSALPWTVWSGVHQTDPVDDFEDPGLRGNVGSHTFDLTPTHANGALFGAIHDNANPENGSSSDLTQITPTEDFTEGWYDADTGPAGNQTWDWTAVTSDRITTGAILFRSADEGGAEAIEADIADELGAAVDAISGQAVLEASITDLLGAVVDSIAAEAVLEAAISDQLGAVVDSIVASADLSAAIADALGAPVDQIAAESAVAIAGADLLGAPSDAISLESAVELAGTDTLGSPSDALLGALSAQGTLIETLGAVADQVDAEAIQEAAIADALGAVTEEIFVSVGDAVDAFVTDLLGAPVDAIAAEAPIAISTADLLGAVIDAAQLGVPVEASISDQLAAAVDAITVGEQEIVPVAELEGTFVQQLDLAGVFGQAVELEGTFVSTLSLTGRIP